MTVNLDQRGKKKKFSTKTWKAQQKLISPCISDLNSYDSLLCYLVPRHTGLQNKKGKSCFKTLHLLFPLYGPFLLYIFMWLHPHPLQPSFKCNLIKTFLIQGSKTSLRTLHSTSWLCFSNMYHFLIYYINCVLMQFRISLYEVKNLTYPWTLSRSNS